MVGDGDSDTKMEDLFETPKKVGPLTTDSLRQLAKVPI